LPWWYVWANTDTVAVVMQEYGARDPSTSYAPVETIHEAIATRNLREIVRILDASPSSIDKLGDLGVDGNGMKVVGKERDALSSCCYERVQRNGGILVKAW